ncbi:MAG: 7-cyano-7-deazaguanine synthase QueC [Immundisolibacteraceae bacterium]|nr:7-cyano-7-deazaguanine synthase QueC [Immundisolibacteraceae bacterium]
MNKNSPRAVILLSGGLDSATLMAIARRDGYRCYAISFDYGQRHRCELDAAAVVAEYNGAVEHKVISLNLDSIGGSALTDINLDVPESPGSGIPITYVPARNTVFLSIGLGWAEVLDAERIYIGVNAVDYSGYPDCRPEYVAAFQTLANLATRQGVEGRPISIEAPLQLMSKAEIVTLGKELKVDYSLTISCYNPAPGGEACRVCDACRLRAQGFIEAGFADPTRYQRET